MKKPRIPSRLRLRVQAQAGRRCGYCLTTEEIIGMPMEIEHILPEAIGGPSSENNACAPNLLVV